MITLSGFGKDYGDFTAVESLDLKIEAGVNVRVHRPQRERAKRTTIRFLATLLRPSRGRGEVAGCDVVGESHRRPARASATCRTTFGVYDGMRVWEFLDFFAVAYRIGRSERKRIIANVLELLDLMHKRDDFVNGLSRGMKQRLCLAKTLLHDPPVLILDEPASGLDPRARIEVKALLKELRKMGKTILISSHILTELADCCTSIGILERGKLLMHGPIDQVNRRLRRNRHVEIDFIAKAEAGLAILRSHAALRGLELLASNGESQAVLAELETDDEGLAGLMEHLIAEGVRMRKFNDKDPTLEDVFMTVTKGLVT